MIQEEKISYIPVSLNKEVLEQLGYEQNLINYYLRNEWKKNGIPVTTLDIPATYNYNGNWYKIVEIDEDIFKACNSLKKFQIVS